MKKSELRSIIKETIKEMSNEQILNKDMGTCAQMFAPQSNMPGGYNPLAWRVGFAKTVAKIYFGGSSNVPSDINVNPYANFPPTTEIQQNPQGQKRGCKFLENRIKGWTGKQQGAGPKYTTMLDDKIGLANCMMVNAFYC